MKIGSEPWRCVIYATKKFTGGMGDDDDRGNGGDKTVWKNYFSKVRLTVYIIDQNP